MIANSYHVFMVEPVTLEVYRDTRLLFWVERDNSSKHTFHGKLVTTTGGVVANQPVKAYLNDTQIAETLTTGSDGCFMFERNFDPTDQKVTYMLKVVYEGTSAKTATLNGTALDGTSYTVCQTTQFNYKPSTNTTTVVVEPQATQVTVPTKTSEEMQQEAENSGGLTVWCEFSWWYPWFRLHVRASVNPTVHLGFNPILPGGEIAEWDGMEFFASLGEEVAYAFAIEFAGLVATYVIARYASLTSFMAGIAVEAGKIVFQTALFFKDWNSLEGMLASSLMTIVMLLFTLTDFFSTASNYVTWFIDSLLKGICLGAVNALTWTLFTLKDMTLWGRGALSAVVDLMEIFADVAMLVIGLRRCVELLNMQ